MSCEMALGRKLFHNALSVSEMESSSLEIMLMEMWDLVH